MAPDPHRTGEIAVQVVAEPYDHLGEGPLWHPALRCLYWVDLFRNRIHRWSPDVPDRHETMAVPFMVSALVLAPSGFVLVTNDGLAFTDEAMHVKRWETYPLPMQPGAHSNDAAADRSGRIWFGTASGPAPANHLFCRHSDGTIRVQERDIGISNGIAWSPDNRTMYYVDSPRSMIYAYAFDPVTGSISDRRAFVHTPDSIDTPDGLTVDSEGFVWCARWDGWRIVRYTPEGRVDTEIPLPVQRPTSCIFGGDGLKTLYITSARAGLSPAQLRDQPQAGSVFGVTLTTGGMAEPFADV